MSSVMTMAAKEAIKAQESLSYEELTNAAKARHHLRRHFGYLPIPVAFYLVFCGMALTHVPIHKMYSAENGLYSAIVTSGTDAITDTTKMKFTNIGAMSDVFSWLNDTFIPTTFVTTDYNGNNLSSEFLHRVQLFHTILGAVEFKTTTAALVSCGFSGPLSKIYPNCHDTSNLVTDYLYIDAGTPPSAAQTIIQDKETSGTWLSLGTTELDVTLAAYDGELKMMSIIELQLQFQLGGFIHLDSDIVAVPSNPYDGPGPIVLDAVVGLFFCGSLIAQARQWYRNCKKSKSIYDCLTFWHVLEWGTLICILVFYILWAILCTYIYDDKLTTLLTAVGVSGASFNQGAHAEQARESLSQLMQRFKLMGHMMTSVRIAAMMAMLFLVARILSAMRFHPNLSVLTSTVAKSLQLFGPFFFVYLVCVAGFVTAGHILFGGRVYAFSTLGYTLVTVINLCFGQFSFDSISSIDYYIALFWYWITLIVLFLVLFNIMLAIVLKSYDEVASVSKGNRSVLSELKVVAKDVIWGSSMNKLDSSIKSGKLGKTQALGLTEIVSELGVTEKEARRILHDAKVLSKANDKVVEQEEELTLDVLVAKVDRLEKLIEMIAIQLQSKDDGARQPSTVPVATMAL